MVSAKLKKLAQEYDLTVTKELAYGQKDGYMLTLSEKSAFKLVSVSAFFSEEQAENSFIEELQKHQHSFGIQEMLQKGYGFSFSFADNLAAIKNMRAFVEWLLPLLVWAGAKGVDYCPLCYNILQGEAVEAQITGLACRAHQGCLTQLAEAALAEEQKEAPEDNKLLRGLLGALGGGLIGAIPWIIVYYLGWFSGWCGLLIGFMADAGYKKLGGRPGQAKLPIIILAVLFSVLVSFVLSTALTFTVMIVRGELYYTLGVVPALTLLYLLDPEFLRDIAPDVIMGLFFAMLGCWGMFAELKNEAQPMSKQIKILKQEE